MRAETGRFHAIVHGRVQGVSFRYYTLRRAEELNVSGWVRNLPDGTVEVDAEGDKPAVDALLAFVWRGPTGAHVTSVDVEWRVPLGATNGFEIR